MVFALSNTVSRNIVDKKVAIGSDQNSAIDYLNQLSFRVMVVIEFEEFNNKKETDDLFESDGIRSGMKR